MSAKQSEISTKLNLSKEEMLDDYKTAFTSRHCSLAGRREVLAGKAKFGIFGAGKEVAQIAMAKAFQKGDWRSGYYRDQTFMFALGTCEIKEFFAQLYADTNLENEPSSGGRQMNSHFCSRYLNDKGEWLAQTKSYNTASDISPTAGQMSRLVGLGYASKLYRENKGLHDLKKFSLNGNEVAFGTIGDASTSEGIFWESLNAAGVLQIPVAFSIWDDGFGISVPKKYQTTKGSISKITAGFHPEEGDESGVSIYCVDGWNYPLLVNTYQKAIADVRQHHRPALIHVKDLTQPQGHSTSGSHERYKDKERLQYEIDMDCIARMRAWLLSENVAKESELAQIEKDSLANIEKQKNEAWQNFIKPIAADKKHAESLLNSLLQETNEGDIVSTALDELSKLPVTNRRGIASLTKRLLIKLRGETSAAKSELNSFHANYDSSNAEKYDSHLYSETDRSPMRIAEILPEYAAKPEKIDGSNVVRRCFDHHLAKNPRLFIIGEDVGGIGGVNTEFEGLQKKHGFWRVTDTGIREATILGQGIGAAVRGLRPIVDIQYLDYVFYCLQGMSDDLATLHYRTAGGQIAPVIVRTKGHRLEGIWHTGSHMGAFLHSIRGMHFCVPRDMVQATGMYNTLLEGDDPAFVCEVLNGYRVKEAVPENLTEFKIPLGTPEVLQEGADITLVTYGACVRIAEDAIKLLKPLGINVELIDARFLMPFDRPKIITESIKKTNAVLFLDEDVSGGASAYMMQQCLDKNEAFQYLDSVPKCLSAKDHRGAYGSDGDYYSKPNAENIFDAIYEIMRERDPYLFPEF